MTEIDKFICEQFTEQHTDNIFSLKNLQVLSSPATQVLQYQVVSECLC